MDDNGARSLKGCIEQQRFVKMHHDRKRVLVDLGCGTAFLSSMCGNYVGVDCNPALVEYLNNAKFRFGKVYCFDFMEDPARVVRRKRGRSFYLGFEFVNSLTLDQFSRLVQSMQLRPGDRLIFDIISLGGYLRRHYDRELVNEVFYVDGVAHRLAYVVSKSSQYLRLRYSIDDAIVETDFYYHQARVLVNYLKYSLSPNAISVKNTFKSTSVCVVF